MAYQLVMKTGPAPGKVYTLDKSVISIGREAGSDVFINDVEVSRKHARLTSQFGDYLLEDLGSTNGTFVNSQHLTGQRILKPGDSILLGENIALAFEEVRFDPNAVQVGVSSESASPEPLEFETSAPQEAQYPSSPPPTYAGKYPESPVEPLVPEESSPRRTWLWVSCGCGLVLVCVFLGLAFVFDNLNLYCTPPFRQVMVLIGAVCP
ncbi:MAG: FHA domain-containing protein [Chloroflexota bacterium]|nr:MAG: FHA domain-containing protein [Chloroflexota bacterium]